MSVKPAWVKVDLISTTQIHTQINAEKKSTLESKCFEEASPQNASELVS